MTVTDTRTSGRTSAARVPSARATITTSYSAATPAITCTTRGSLRARQLLHLLEQRHLLRAVEAWRSGRSAHTARGWLPRVDRAGHACTRRDWPAAAMRAHRARGIEQRGFGDVVGIGERRLLASHGAHAHALVDAEAAALDDAFFQAPALVARGLEVQVGVVDAVLADGRQRLRNRASSSSPNGSSRGACAMARRSMVGSRRDHGGLSGFVGVPAAALGPCAQGCFTARRRAVQARPRVQRVARRRR